MVILLFASQDNDNNSDIGGYYCFDSSRTA